MNSGYIQIAPGIADDTPGLIEVLYRGWISTYPNEEHGITVDDIEEMFKDRHTDEYLMKRREQLANPSENTNTYIAKLEGQVVGLCIIKKLPDANQIVAIYVHPDFQGKGIGTALWNEVKKHFDPGKPTIVEVAVYNARAIRFYEGLGFVDTGFRMSDPRLTMKSGAIISEMQMIRRAERVASSISLG